MAPLTASLGRAILKSAICGTIRKVLKKGTTTDPSGSTFGDGPGAVLELVDVVGHVIPWVWRT